MPESSNMRLAVDAMGGDRAPAVVVEGAVEYARLNPQAHSVLVGDESKVKAELQKLGGSPSNISVVHASQVVEMHEHPVEALTKKRDSSIVRCFGLVRKGEADAVISAGNTGAAVAAATLGLKHLEGVKRAGIAIPLPTKTGNCVIIDVGANINCKPVNLLQYAVMASQYRKYIFNGAENPTIGLLNIGEESTKGTELTQQTYQWFKKTSLNFIGNVEGHEIFGGKCDVVVCDGFVGNTILKVIEGFSSFLLKRVAGRLQEDGVGAQEIAHLSGVMDYSEYGGAPLLGINGVVIISHGRSNAKAIRNAMRVGADFVAKKVNHHIVEEVKKLTLWGRLHERFWHHKE